MKLTVGQKLWFVPSKKMGNPHEVVIAKIGHKWATLEDWRGERIDIETLIMDGGEYISPGQCYLSEQAWKDAVALDLAWFTMRKVISYGIPDGVTVENIEQARRILKI